MISCDYIRKAPHNQLGPNTTAPKKNTKHNAEQTSSELLKIGHRHFLNGCYLSALYYFQLPELEFDTEAQFWQGYIYRYGKEGIPINPPLALECFLKSVSSYTSNACNQIGLAFEQGFGVPIDLQKALEWYYMGNQCSFNTVKLLEQGFTLSPQEKKKPMEKLIKETLEIMKGNKGKSKQLENQQENQVTEEYT